MRERAAWRATGLTGERGRSALGRAPVPVRELRGEEIRGQWEESILGIKVLYREEASGFLFQVCYRLWWSNPVGGWRDVALAFLHSAEWMLRLPNAGGGQPGETSCLPSADAPLCLSAESGRHPERTGSLHLCGGEGRGLPTGKPLRKG